MKIGILGLGFVGLTLAAKISEKGFSVVGIEKDHKKLDILKDGKAPFLEPGLDDLLSSLQRDGKLYICHPDEILNNLTDYKCDLIIVTVGTPVTNAKVDMSALEDIKPLVLRLIKKESIVALRSTVAVGTCRKYEADLRASNANFLGVCSVPERTAEGIALRELEELPQIIGANSKKISNKVKEVFLNLASECIELSSTEAAEFSKLISNCYRDFSFSIANLFQFAAEDLNLDGKEIIEAVNHNYPRANIGKPGPVAGPCLEKDAYIFAASLNSNSTDLKDLVIRLRKNNEDLTNRIVKKVLQLSKTKPIRKICICGIAFKGNPQTDDIRGSLAIPVAELLSKNFELILQDYQFRGEVKIGDSLFIVQEDIPEDVDFYVLMNNHEKYKFFNKDNINAWD